jgi:phosphoserine aminotransferase
MLTENQSATVGNLVGVWVERRRIGIEKEAGSNASDSEKISLLRKAVEEELKVDYIVTGSWSSKASQEAVSYSEYGSIH